jgi:Uncharacterized conserved protein
MNTKEEIAAQDIQALRNELSQLRKDFSSMAGRWKDLAGEIGSDAYDGVRATAGKVRTRAESMAEEVTDTIEHRPLLSIVTAFVIGLLLGVLFGRQR